MELKRLEEGTSAEMTIVGSTFTVRAPYLEGDVLTAAEASTLNQTWRENIRNNKADAVSKMKADGVEFGNIQQMITDYEVDYEFGVRGGGGPRSSDPIQTEANRIARNLLKAAISQNPDLKMTDYTTEQTRGLVKQILGENPAIMDQAKANVEATNAATAGVLSGLSIPAGEAKKDEAA